MGDQLPLRYGSAVSLSLDRTKKSPLEPRATPPNPGRTPPSLCGKRALVRFMVPMHDFTIEAALDEPCVEQTRLSSIRLCITEGSGRLVFLVMGWLL